ncbi:ankyrin repeat and BTB/POZ domain-containing protein 1-like [Gigantopelta aegis]|uniref:ankyrin repeat and BTB/POZ domain-containing protein 1-like n=1 Tax=Gigantopelta aegis TaxID=1735272 RepID=UPI001B88933D|nr:ankyrin repeat and BTB/POZ domain-containing protein 1-like [Gigantopelta aegis]
MALHEFFSSCKTGDFQKVKFLVEEREVEVNCRDKWDSTPLYYACLCGHKDVVQFLLEHGAKCEANTFDGERCLYGALTDEIKKMLKSFCVISSRTLRRSLYEEFLRKMLQSADDADVTFSVHGERFPVHRCVLCARSTYFTELFKTRWKDRSDIDLKHELIYPWAFQAVLQYLYTGHLECHVDMIDDCIRVAKQCQLLTLMNQIEEKLKKKFSLESQKPGVSITTLMIEPEENLFDLQMDLGQLADLALPSELNTWVSGELPFEPENNPLFPDLYFSVHGHVFMCHQVFFCGRSDYFKVLLNDHFGETTVYGNIPVIKLHDVSPSIFIRILYYVYQDSCELTTDNVYDVLCAADLYLLPGLKRLCANYMTKFLDAENVVSILRTSRLFTLPRLESQCAEYIANNLEKVIEQEEFADLVREDASNLKEREEADTIDIIDEVRFYITNFIQTFSDMEEANDRLKVIDDLLEELDLEG